MYLLNSKLDSLIGKFPISLSVNLNDIEPHVLAQRPAFSEDNDISLLQVESRRAMRHDVVVSLLVPLVLRDVLQVVHSDDNSPLHLGALHFPTKNLPADGDVSGKGTLLIHPSSVLKILHRGLVTHPDLLENSLGLGTDFVLVLDTCILGVRTRERLLLLLDGHD